jgi:hypothetical protein
MGGHGQQARRRRPMSAPPTGCSQSHVHVNPWRDWVKVEQCDQRSGHPSSIGNRGTGDQCVYSIKQSLPRPRSAPRARSPPVDGKLQEACLNVYVVDAVTRAAVPGASVLVSHYQSFLRNDLKNAGSRSSQNTCTGVSGAVKCRLLSNRRWALNRWL